MIGFAASCCRYVTMLRCICLASVLVGATPDPASAADSVRIPNFWDPRLRQERPELPQDRRTLRFLTDDEFPPLHFGGADGSPTGFSVELARAACEKLALTCTVQARRFDTLLDALAAKDGDVVAAAIPLTAGLRARFSATRPYFRWPARFAARLDRGMAAPGAAALKDRTVGIVGGSAHEAYLKAFFPGATARTFSDLPAAEAALRRGEVDYAFGDGLNLALWIGGEDAAGCCGFSGGDYLENRYFGEGIGFLTRKDDPVLAQALDDALQRLWDEGKYTELYLRFFPVGPF